MTLPTKIGITVGAALVLAIVTVATLIATRGEPDRTAATTGADTALIRSDSRILGEPGSTEVTFVEFLDFECEGCRAAHPYVEQLRETYGDRVTFVVRYFPMPGHFNGERAARSVESAARQDKLEEMYNLMYETQEAWGEQQEPADDVFRGFAEQIGLDMDRYDTDYASEEVAARVQRDITDGQSLGVSGTPTFYIDGTLLQPRTVDDLTTAIEQALNGR